MPILLAPTIINDSLTLGLVYRPSCLSATQAERLMDVLLARLAELGAVQSKEKAAERPLVADAAVAPAAG